MAPEPFCDIYAFDEFVSAVLLSTVTSLVGRLKRVLPSGCVPIRLPPFIYLKTSCISGRSGFLSFGNCYMYSCWIDNFLCTSGPALAERSTIFIGVGVRRVDTSFICYSLRFLMASRLDFTSYTLLWRRLRSRPSGDRFVGLRFKVSVSNLLVIRSLLQLVRFKFFIFLWSCSASKLIGVLMLRRYLLRVMALRGAINSPFWYSYSC